MCILPKFQRKGHGRYSMSKVFKCDAELDSRVYAVTRLIHDYTPYRYEELENEYSNYALYNPLQKYTIDDKEEK